jgi:periplasmic nitrate reductase NapD
VNFSGILVMAKPDHHSQVIAALNALEGVEVHQVDAATGRIVAVQEAEDIHAEIEGVKRIKAIAPRHHGRDGLPLPRRR